MVTLKPWHADAERHSRQTENAGSDSRQNGRRLWREGPRLVEQRRAVCARPPVFPRTMPNGAFVKVSSFTADAGAARSPDNRSLRTDSEGRRKVAASCALPRARATNTLIIIK
ncbi:unnamed protein product [Pieris brassicae]|uniref:Uncharacterized protein n=1 Tax=Pieris brassicae TaxID=7116 RepID=A0A9P0XB90_PIEBR|nr:unnamed protein product [Pieris brassicae]